MNENENSPTINAVLDKYKESQEELSIAKGNLEIENGKVIVKQQKAKAKPYRTRSLSMQNDIWDIVETLAKASHISVSKYVSWIILEHLQSLQDNQDNQDK